MKTSIIFAWILMGIGVGAAGTASAYVGPGAGLSLLGALWGLLLAVGAALGFVILWPLRRLRKRGQERRAAEADNRPLNRPAARNGRNSGPGS